MTRTQRGSTALPMARRCSCHGITQTPFCTNGFMPRRDLPVIFHAASIRRRSRRRSSSPRPPQMPWRSLLASAIARHSTRTAQPAQIRFARVTRPPRSGKNQAGSVSRHAARAVHGGGLTLGSTGGCRGFRHQLETKILARLDRIDAQERLRDEAGDPDLSRLKGKLGPEGLASQGSGTQSPSNLPP